MKTHTHTYTSYGVITAEECSALNELYNYNPLLFDIASKRLVRGQNGEQFPASVFKAHPNLPPSRPTTISQQTSEPTSEPVELANPVETST